ncbi:MAG: 16S rRNA (uracil(1498)-N(3))-methyltransferase [Rhodospirillales bacterium]|nr:16S rRNA (uracil(1498)-N(3))-methyltransferase [Rhodospirillales bacterium]
MTFNSIRTRLYHPGPLQAGAEISLSADQAHFLGNVLRLHAGDRIALFNADDGEWSGPLAVLKKRNAEVVVDDQRRPGAPEPGPWLAFAPLKKARTQIIVEKATELGVARLLPVITANTIGGRVNEQRMAAQALEAAEQCERLSLPEVAAPQTLAQLLAGWPSARRLLVADETGGGMAIADAISSTLKNSADCGILIGPEGGFRADELELLKVPEFCTFIDLGPRILRAETAAIVALACIGALT